MSDGPGFSHAEGDLRAMLPLAGPLRGLGRKHVSDLLRILPMPVADLLDEYFESDALKGAIAASAIDCIPPSEPPTDACRRSTPR